VTTRERSALASFRAEYGSHRAAEGRAHDRMELLALPYLKTGPLARQWGVRARSFDVFMERVLGPLARDRGAPLRVLDLGAGNGWLSYRAAMAGHDALALDIRDDDADGLGAASRYLDGSTTRFGRIVASFDALPLGDHRFDVVVFNAAVHYALDLELVLGEATRVVRRGGRVVIVDSPFYAEASAGDAMVEEKRRHARERFGTRAEALLALPFIEYLTADGLAEASRSLGLEWQRHRVRYPLWYEWRLVSAWMRGRRPPSRFDVWEGRVR
jgi:SAM-dependent methyltransferase